MISIPELSITDELLMSLRRHLRIPPGHVLLDGRLEPPQSAVSIIEPYEYTHRFRPRSSEIGQPLALIFHKRFPFRSEYDWRTKQIDGHIGVNDHKTGTEYQVIQSDMLFHRNIGVCEPAVPADIRVLGYNDEYLWVDKPSPLPMHSGGRYHRNTVVSMLEKQGLGPVFIVHRLDAVTSGLILLARSESAAALAAKLVSDFKVEKTYEAIVRGNPKEHDHEVTVSIKRDRGFLFTCSDDADAKEARTRFKVIHQGEGWAHISCMPITGRTHQIRLHLAHWGYPIWDDNIYNGSAIGDERFKLRQDRPISLISLGLKATI
jgi:RluA family pseudouridine synthase